MKHYKILLEFIKKDPSELGSIAVQESIVFGTEISKIAEKYGFVCLVKGYPQKPE